MTNSPYTAWNISIHLCMVIFGWSNLGSIPTCAPLFTATPLQQVAKLNGNLPGESFKRSTLPAKPKSCALRWPAQSKPGCSTGQLVDGLKTVALHLASFTVTDLHTCCLLICFLGICGTRWIHPWSGSKMPHPPLSTLQTTWLASLWHGTLSGLSGHTFSLSKYIRVTSLVSKFTLWSIKKRHQPPFAKI